MSHIRLLPLLIFSVVLMLSVRLGTLWQGAVYAFASGDVLQKGIVLSETGGGLSGGGAPLGGHQGDSSLLQVAAASDPAAKPGSGVPASGSPASGAPASGAPAPEGAAPAATPSKKGETGGASPEPSPVSVGLKSPAQDPLSETSSFSPSEVDVLQRLAERREQIDAREKELSTREDLIKAAEARIETKVTELRTLQTSIQDLLKQYDAQEKAKVDRLVTIYGTMKPKEAAQIFDGLDMSVLMAIVENMKEAKSAPIMAAMNPEKARAVTGELTRRRQLAVPSGGTP